MPQSCLLHALLINDINRLHDIRHVLRRHFAFPAVRNTCRHLLVRHIDISVPRKIRLFLLIPLILQDLQRTFYHADLLAGRGKQSKRHIGTRTQDITPCLRIFDLVKIFYIGGCLCKTQPHLGYVLPAFRELQTHQFITYIIISDTKPVQFFDNFISIFRQSCQI